MTETSDNSRQDLLTELTVEIVCAHVGNNVVQVSDLPGLIAQVHSAPGSMSMAAPAEGPKENTMPDKITNELLFEQLEAIQARLRNVENGQAEIRTTLVGIQQHMTGFMTNATAHEGAIVTIQGRLDRIERRLGLTDASAE